MNLPHQYWYTQSYQDLLQAEYPRLFRQFQRVAVIGDRLNEEKINLMQLKFKSAHRKRLNREMFRDALATICKITLTDDEFHVLFMKMDTKRDGFIDWDEFLSNVLLEFQEKEMGAHLLELQRPIKGHPRVLKSNHRLPVTRILFSPAITQDRITNYLQGKYLSVSRDGIISYWNIDFEFERTVTSTALNLKVHPTWVTDFVCLPDVSIICTSSTERDLRFYDTTANKFELRVVISSWDSTITKMHYHFYKNFNEESVLILGDVNGNVRVLLIVSKDKGPFYHKPGIDVTHIYYDRLVHGDLKGMRLYEHRNIHFDWVNQVSFYQSFKSFISCSLCPKNSLYFGDVAGTKTSYSYNIEKGVTCFNFCEEAHLIVTGSPDCVVRVWNIFVQRKPICSLRGHHTNIVAIILQDGAEKIYSLSKDKIIKVWLLHTQSCIQTYNWMPPELGERTPLCAFYNPANRNLIVASMKIAIIVCCEQINLEEIDGYTHTKPVTRALYNPLFNVIVTVGKDSCIMVWDPWNGIRLLLVRDAHSIVIFGERQPIKITASTYSPDYQLLLTGARDGSIKMWNFNTGACLRTMNIQYDCQVSDLVWLQSRILAVGWNKHITEFADTDVIAPGKQWDTRHYEDITCTAVCLPETLATISYSGELVLWRLETGQPVRFYNLADPTAVSTVPLKATRLSLKASGHKKKHKTNLCHLRSKRFSETETTAPVKVVQQTSSQLSLEQKKKQWAVTHVAYPPELKTKKTIAAHTMLFLLSRPLAPNVGTLLVSMENGMIQLWAHHPAGGYVNSFFCIHGIGDYVLAMATDKENNYLFTGSTVGYIKIWLLQNYGVPNPPKVSMPIIRLQFPFLLSSRFQGRAKRAVRGQSLPLLLSSYRGHLRAVNHLEYIDSCKILVSSSSDSTVRLWTLAGGYLGTLGTILPWEPLIPHIPPPIRKKQRVPPDIRKVASSTTIKVIGGGRAHVVYSLSKDETEKLKEMPSSLVKQGAYGTRLTVPYLGHHLEIPPTVPSPAHLPSLDISLPVTPVYCFLDCKEINEVRQLPDSLSKFLKQSNHLSISSQ